MSKKYYLYVHNTMTGKTEKVEVTKDVYIVYRRTEWNIRDNDESFSKHEIQFSSLIGGENGNYENFHEFVDFESTLDVIYEKEMLYKKLNFIIESLSSKDKELLCALFEDGLTELDYASKINVSQQAISKKKLKILKKIKKLLKNWL